MNVLILENSLVECDKALDGYPGGSTYYWDAFTVSSSGEATLTIIGLTRGISARGSVSLAGAKVDITSMSTDIDSSSAPAKIPIRAYKTLLSITDSNVKITTKAYLAISAHATGGYVEIANSNITIIDDGTTDSGQATTLGAINSYGSLTVTGGSITTNARKDRPYPQRR